MCLDVLDKKIVSTGIPAMFRVVMLYNRDHRRLAIQWVAKYESTGRTHLCMAWKRL